MKIRIHTKNVHKITKVRDTSTMLGIAGVVWMFASMLLALLLNTSKVLSSTTAATISICFVFIPTAILIFTGLKAASRYKQKIIKEISKQSVEHKILATLALIELLGQADGWRYRATIHKELSQLLPQLQRAEIFRISSSHWTILYEEMLVGDMSFALSILQFIHHAGMLTALPYINLMLSNSATAHYSEQVFDLANICKTMLSSRSDRVASPYILLRSSALSIPPDVLLRPASGISQSKMEENTQLLRPTVGQDNEEDAPK